ncbi:hypothetical protein [Streptomyces sp. NRRL S-237]|uniref:hypothetical protein n=1 Tax=Streptomyces sp. NRRL S-237 TaxID=1463895 RepID=UPI0004CA03A2|nr:hypothetical protein [Streptomyces sp. NRRL S-237]
MDNDGAPRPGFFHRLGNAFKKVLTWCFYLVVALFAIGWITLIIMGNFVWDTPDDAEPAWPTSSPSASTTPITWLHVSGCRDGWPSSSIGEQEACSDQGGVINYYVSAPGNFRTTCGVGSLRPRTLERAAQLNDGTGVVACDTAF